MSIEWDVKLEELCRYAGGESPLLHEDSTFFGLCPPPKRDLAREGNSVPSWNTMEHLLVARPTHGTSVRCRISMSTKEHPGGLVECLGRTETLSECHVFDEQGRPEWSDGCDSLVGKVDPPLDREHFPTLEEFVDALLASVSAAGSSR